MAALGKCVKQYGKTLLVDMLPIISSVAMSFFHNDEAISIVLSIVLIGVCIFAIFLDWLFCRSRWAQKLPAICPKMPPVATAVGNVVTLAVLLSGWITYDQFVAYSGVFASGAVCLISGICVVLGPRFSWTKAFALDIMDPETLRAREADPVRKRSFETKMPAFDKAWTLAFLAITLLSVIQGFVRVHMNNDTLCTVIGVGGPMAVVVVMSKCIIPRIITKLVAQGIREAEENSTTAAGSTGTV